MANETSKNDLQGWDRDLRPNQAAASNASGERRSARDVKELAAMLDGIFTDSELREIPLVEEGERLVGGSTYIDLAERVGDPFTATDGMVAAPGSLLVRRTEVPYMYWNRLIGNRELQRTEGAPARPG